MSVQLTQEQAAVVASRGGQLLVSAAAGSGKTFVLVQRLLDRVIREGLDLDQFLIITFTKAAAAELRSKIMDALRKALQERPGDAHLKRQTTLIYRTQISTIHAFCTRLLRESSAQLDLDPDFRMAEDSEAGLLRSQTLDRVLEEAYANLDQGHFASLVDTLSAGRDDNRLKTIVLDIHTRSAGCGSSRRPLTWRGSPTWPRPGGVRCCSRTPGSRWSTGGGRWSGRWT